MKKYESPEVKVNSYELNHSVAVNLGSEVWWDDEFDTPEEGNE